VPSPSEITRKIETFINRMQFKHAHFHYPLVFDEEGKTGKVVPVKPTLRPFKLPKHCYLHVVCAIAAAYTQVRI